MNYVRKKSIVGFYGKRTTRLYDKPVKNGKLRELCMII